MGSRTKIEWTDATWNPVTGCTKVSAGCKFCYAERDFHRPYPGRAFTDVRTHPSRLDWPLRWRGSNQAKAEGRKSRIFVNSMSDLFHEDIPLDFLDSIFAVMALADRHVFQVLTKRPERMLQYFTRLRSDSLTSSSEARIAGFAVAIAKARGEDTASPYWDMPLEQPYLNVWLGVSVEDQKTADERIPLLLQTPAAVRFVSYEPALGPVDFIPYLDPSCQALNRLPRAQVDWVIAGGESGPSARPPHPQWVLHVRDQCEAAGTPFFFKQWGEWQWVTYVDGGHGILKVSVPGYSAGQQPKKTWREIVFSNGAPGTSVNMLRVGKARAGRTVSGREWNEFPQVPA